jgi:hypothetical protein
MPGQRLDIDSIGESYEVFVQSVLSRIATLTRIGAKQDFGTDTYCEPRVAIGARVGKLGVCCRTAGLRAQANGFTTFKPL